MCDMCVDHGDGMQWHFNAANYARRLYKIRKESGEATGAEISGLAGFPQADEILELIEALDRGDMDAHESLLREYESKARREMLGQTLTIDEVLRAVEFMYPIARMTCMCRKITEALPDEENQTCIGFGPGLYKWERWPETYHGGIEFLHPDDARELLIELNKQGFAQIMFTMGTPYIGGLCSCQYPGCLAIRERLDYGIKGFWKGHDVARIDPNLCTGCGLCAPRCQFKAMSFDPSRGVAFIDPFRCFGCGLCVSVCESGAITLERREAIPTLANVW